MEGSGRVSDTFFGERGGTYDSATKLCSVIDSWMDSAGRRHVAPDAQRTPADGDDYTYDLRTPTERAAFRIEQAEARLARLETELRTEIRTLAERIQHIEHVLEQWTGDHG